MSDLNIVFINWLAKNAKTCLYCNTQVQVGPEWCYLLDLNFVFINLLEKNAKTCLYHGMQVQVGPEWCQI